MAAEIMRQIILITLASSAAIVLVGLARRPVRLLAGAEACYWIWSLVPVASLAVLLPAPAKPWLLSSHLPSAYASPLEPFASVRITGSEHLFPVLLLAIWLGGAGLLAWLLVGRQLKFIRALGDVSPDAAGLWRGQSVIAPMLIGILRPRLLVPAGFEQRYSPEERVLILAHERAHWARGDLPVAGLASLWLCFSWFNPLVYLAVAWLRQDQELACDAIVLRRTQSAPRRYAAALLKTQLLEQSAWRIPIACYWHSIHPLTQRIAMLKRPLPGLARRLTAMTLIGSLSLVGGYSAWGFRGSETGSPPILVHLKLTVKRSGNAGAARSISQELEYVANAGEAMKISLIDPYSARCVASLPDAAAAASIPSSVSTNDRRVELQCLIRENGRVVATPALITIDGASASVEMVSDDRPSEFVLEVTATTSKARIAAARRSAR